MFVSTRTFFIALTAIYVFALLLGMFVQHALEAPDIECVATTNGLCTAEEWTLVKQKGVSIKCFKSTRVQLHCWDDNVPQG